MVWDPSLAELISEGQGARTPSSISRTALSCQSRRSRAIFCLHILGTLGIWLLSRLPGFVVPNPRRLSVRLSAARRRSMVAGDRAKSPARTWSSIRSAPSRSSAGTRSARPGASRFPQIQPEASATTRNAPITRESYVWGRPRRLRFGPLLTDPCFSNSIAYLRWYPLAA